MLLYKLVGAWMVITMMELRQHVQNVIILARHVRIHQPVKYVTPL